MLYMNKILCYIQLYIILYYYCNVLDVLEEMSVLACVNIEVAVNYIHNELKWYDHVKIIIIICQLYIKLM